MLGGRSSGGSLHPRLQGANPGPQPLRALPLSCLCSPHKPPGSVLATAGQCSEEGVTR